MLTSGIIEVDVHGCTAVEAKKKIDIVINKAHKSVYRIRVVHGYRTGTVLRDMVRYDYRNHEKVIRIATTVNAGETDLILREL